MPGEWPLSIGLVESRLDGLQRSHLICFAAGVAERLLPNFSAFHDQERWGSPAVLRKALDAAWGLVTIEAVGAGAVHDLLVACEGQCPDTENFRSRFTSAALDAAVAVCEALDCCLDGRANHAATVGSLAGDTIYLFETDPQVRDQLVASECQRQADDIAALRGAPVLSADWIATFRKRSTAFTQTSIGVRRNG